MDERCTNIATAIVGQAVIDYKRALRGGNKTRMKECERFFLGSWGQWLSANHGEYIIRRCRDEVKGADNEQRAD